MTLNDFLNLSRREQNHYLKYSWENKIINLNFGKKIEYLDSNDVVEKHALKMLNICPSSDYKYVKNISKLIKPQYKHKIFTLNFSIKSILVRITLIFIKVQGKLKYPKVWFIKLCQDSYSSFFELNVRIPLDLDENCYTTITEPAFLYFNDFRLCNLNISKKRNSFDRFFKRLAYQKELAKTTIDFLYELFPIKINHLEKYQKEDWEYAVSSYFNSSDQALLRKAARIIVRNLNIEDLKNIPSQQLKVAIERFRTTLGLVKISYINPAPIPTLSNIRTGFFPEYIINTNFRFDLTRSEMLYLIEYYNNVGR